MAALLGLVEAGELLTPVVPGVELRGGGGAPVKAQPSGHDLFHNRFPCQFLHLATPDPQKSIFFRL